MRFRAGVRFWVLIGSAIMMFGQEAVANQVPAPRPKDEKKDERPASVHVKGKVIDRDGRAVSNCEVIFAGARGELKKTTDATGNFIADIPPGRYSITAKAGNAVQGIQADITANMELPAITLPVER